MNNNTYSLLFFIRKERTNKTGQAPLYLRIKTNKTTAEISLSRRIKPGEWDPKAGKAKGHNPNAKKINNYIDVVKSKFLQYHQELIYNGDEITARALKMKFLGVDENSKTLIQAFEYHNQKMEKLKGLEYASETVIKFNTLLKMIKVFLQDEYQIKDIKLNKLKYQFIEDLKTFFMVKYNNSENTAEKKVRNFKKIIHMSIRNNWLIHDPFANYKGKLKEVKIEFLSKEELKQIENKEFPINRLEVVRDLFIFSCYTGLAYGDAQALTTDNLYTEEDGTVWIKTQRKKTNNTSNIPLLEKPKEIIEKYKSHPQVITTERLLPKITNQKQNAYLKEIQTLCDIRKPLHTHIARHTFATTVTLSQGIPIEIVSKMLGHSSIQMTQKYAKVIDEYTKQEMKKLTKNK